MRQRGIVCYGNKKRHTEDNSPKYRMVGTKFLSIGGESKRSSETSYACERGLSSELNNRLDCHAIARNDVKNLCHPELGATHVDLCDNIHSYFIY